KSDLLLLGRRQPAAFRNPMTASRAGAQTGQVTPESSAAASSPDASQQPPPKPQLAAEAGPPTPAPPRPPPDPPPPPPPPLALAALGVVYGDIGTSPLYALRECFLGNHALALTPANVIGVLSLIFWALTLVISVKYLVFVMRADNRGEGGILALLSLVKAGEADRSARLSRFALLLLGLFGAALLYGDGVLTPSISVLSAVEGLGVATHTFDPFIVPITIGILLSLFSVQRHGTAGIGAVFGPLMLIWFTTIGVAGAAHVFAEH